MDVGRERKIQTSARQIRQAARNLLVQELPLQVVLEAVEEVQRHLRDISAEALEEYEEEITAREMAEATAGDSSDSPF